MITEIDNQDQWVCRCCMHRDDFKLPGKGLIECSVCGAQHFVSADGELFLINLGERK